MDPLSATAAFRPIAAALGSTQMALYADSCEVNDVFLEGQSFENCVRALESTRGSPRTDCGEFVDEFTIEDDNVFAVWFLIDSWERIEASVRSKNSPERLH